MLICDVIFSGAYSARGVCGCACVGAVEGRAAVRGGCGARGGADFDACEVRARKKQKIKKNVIKKKRNTCLLANVGRVYKKAGRGTSIQDMSVKRSCVEGMSVKRIPGGQDQDGMDLLDLLTLEPVFLRENGLGIHVYNYGCCKRMLTLVRSGHVAVGPVLVSLAGKDQTVARQIMDYLRLPKLVWTGLVLWGLHMRMDRMTGCFEVSLTVREACE